MIQNQDDFYTDDECYRSNATVQPTPEPVKGCPYLFPASIFEDIAESIIVDDGLVVANAFVGVQYDLVNEAGEALPARSWAIVAGNQLYEILSSPSQLPVTNLSPLRVFDDEDGPYINAIDPENQDPCYA